MKKCKKQLDIVSKMTLFGMLGVVISLVVMISIACSGGKEDKKNTVNTDETDVEETLEYDRMISVIKEVNTDTSKLLALDIEQEEVLTLNIDGAVDIKDVYGTIISLAQLNIGDMVEIKYEKNKMRPEYIHKTAKVWERKNIQNVSINEKAKTIQVANDIYTYTDDLVTVFNGSNFDVSQIDLVDEVTLRGYKDKVWTVILENGHGFITLKNHSSFIGGILEVGNRMNVDIQDVTSITVPVGVHEIIANKEDMIPYVAEVIVEENKEVVLDLNQSLPKKGLVNFDIKQEGVTLSINDKEYQDLSEPISLDYGIYTIRAKKNNYVTMEEKLVLDRAYVDYKVELEKEPIFIHIDSPQGVGVYIDGNYIGIIPVTAPMDVGNHTVTLRKEGYYSKMYPITIDDTIEDNYFTFPKLIEIEEPVEQEEKEDASNSEDNSSSQTPVEDVYGN